VGKEFEVSKSWMGGNLWQKHWVGFPYGIN